MGGGMVDGCKNGGWVDDWWLGGGMVDWWGCWKVVKKWVVQRWLVDGRTDSYAVVIKKN